MIGAEDLLPKAKNIPTGKQNKSAKIEIMNVRERPPQALVSTHFNPNWPPEIKLIDMNGKTNNRKRIIYFLNLTGTKNAAVTKEINKRKDTFILHISESGYNP